MFTATWLLGIVATISALTICRAETRGGNAGIDFDKPLRRALAIGLACASLGLLLFYGMLGDGIVWPLAAFILLSGAAIWAGRSFHPVLSRSGGLAICLALFGFVCVIAAFQQVYGDFFFGFDDPFAR